LFEVFSGALLPDTAEHQELTENPLAVSEITGPLR
jgi:hypothetical protein